MVIRNKLLTAVAASSLLFSSVASAAEIECNTAQMQAMDKITGRVSVVDVPVNSEVTFGSFSIVVRACKTTPPEETPENYAFVDVADSSFGKMQFNIFKGWMMSSSPALNAVEHPIYDVWLLKCTDTKIDKSKLLTKEQLEERDALPILTDIKREAAKVAEENKPLEQNIEINQDENKVLKDYTKPSALKEQTSKNARLTDSDTQPLMPEKKDGPQSLLNIAPSATMEHQTAPLSSEAFDQVDKTEDVSSEESQKQLSEETTPLVMSDVPLSPIAEVLVENVSNEVDGNISEDLPEDEEEQFIDLSNEAEETVALEAELKVEALKE